VRNIFAGLHTQRWWRCSAIVHPLLANGWVFYGCWFTLANGLGLFFPHHYQTWCGRCKVRPQDGGNQSQKGGRRGPSAFGIRGMWIPQCFQRGAIPGHSKVSSTRDMGALGILWTLVAKMPSMRGPGALNKCPLWGAQGTWKCPQWGGGPRALIHILQNTVVKMSSMRDPRETWNFRCRGNAQGAGHFQNMWPVGPLFFHN